MSDNSNSTGSSGSSANSWTLLSPEEAAVESVGPVDDGTESLGDVPSLSEEVAGAVGDFKSSDIPVETVLSEEGHQICQETSPESSEGPVPSTPDRMSPLSQIPLDPSDLDLDSQPPVIHDIDASSPSDNDLLGAVPFVTNIDLGIPLDIPLVELPPADPEESCSALPIAEIPISTEPSVDTPAHIEPCSASDAEESVEFNIPAETLSATDPPSHVEDEIRFEPESTEPLKPDSKNLVTEQPNNGTPTPENVGSIDAQEEATVENVEEHVEEHEPPVTVSQDEREENEEPSTSFHLDDTSSFDDGLRRRNLPSFEAQRSRTSDEEDEEEEMEFKLAEKKEEKPWFSLNKCIVGALILLFLGSLFLSGDFDASDLSDGEQSQDWLSSDPQDMKALLDKLTQENQQISLLEAQLQSQKEELDSALKALAANDDEMVKADLEKENTKLKEELSFLPELKKELESLRARVTELSQLTVTADQEIPPAIPSSAPEPDDKYSQSIQKAAEPEMRKGKSEEGRLKEELQRQKGLLEESRKRLEGMKKHGGDRKHVRDSLEEIQRKLSEQVERWGKKKKKPQESKWKGNKGKGNEQDHRKKEEKKEGKHSKEGELKDKEEKKEKEGKSQKQNSQKETWRKHQDEWQRKKDERRMDREERRKEKPWHSHSGKNSNSHHQHQHQHHHHHHQPRQPHQHNHNDFWRDQEQKLQRNIRPQVTCTSVEDCAYKEGLYPVELPEFEELLEGYLSKLEGSSTDSKDKIRKLTADFFKDGVFIHDKVLFNNFAEDVADILEDMVDVLEGNGQNDDDSLEKEMEEFEREALWKFAATP